MLIHVTNPCVSPGDQVLGGVTQVGAVRKLSAKMRLQLSDYTSGPGDHTHVQLNRVKPGTTEAVAEVLGVRMRDATHSSPRPAQEAAKPSVELVADQPQASAAPLTLEPDVHAYARDLPLVRAAGVPLLELDDVAHSHGCDGDSQGRPRFARNKLDAGADLAEESRRGALCRCCPCGIRREYTVG